MRRRCPPFAFRLSSFFGPTHKQKVWDARELPESVRELQFLVRHTWFLECSKSETALERGGHVVFERAVTTKDWRTKRCRDLLIPSDALKIAIDGKYVEG